MTKIFLKTESETLYGGYLYIFSYIPDNRIFVPEMPKLAF